MRCLFLVFLIAGIAPAAHAQMTSPFPGSIPQQDVATRNAIVDRIAQGKSEQSERAPGADSGNRTGSTRPETTGQATGSSFATVTTSACHTQCNFNETVAKMACALFRQDSSEQADCLDQATSSRAECDSRCK